MSQLLSYLHGKDFTSSKSGPQKCIVDPDIAQFNWKELGEKMTLAVVVSKQCTSQGSLRNRRKIYHTPHFPYSALRTPHSALRTLRTPHSALRTLHSALRTPHSALRTPHSALHTPHSALRTPHSSYSIQPS